MIGLATLISGLVFGLGLVVSGLINPAKVVAFLDVSGAWDPSLALTMATAVAVTGIGYRLAFARGAPVLTEKFQIPSAAGVDARLIGGAAIFGAGWGLVGFCPGPALAASGLGSVPALVFTAALLVGMATARQLNRIQTAAASLGEAKKA